MTYANWVVESKVLVQRAQRFNVGGLQIPSGHVQVLRQAARVVALGDDGDVALGGPAEQHLGGGLAVLLGNRLDGRVVEQQRRVLGLLVVQLQEAQRAEGRVRRHSDALLLHVLDQRLLGQVRVVLDLQGRRANARVPQQVHDQLGAEVADADAARQLLVNQGLHGLPRLLDRRVAELDLILGARPARRVFLGRVDVFQRDREVNEIQVKVIDAPVGQLLPGDRLDLVGLVERVPQLGHNEEVLTLHNAFLDGASDALAGLNLVAIV